MDELVMKVKFGIKSKLKRLSVNTLNKTDNIKIFNKTIKVSDVALITLTEETQNLVKCKINKEITYKNPWTKINKHPILQNLQTEEIIEEYEPFIPYKTILIDYPEDELLIIYAVDEMREEDVFYFCLNYEEQSALIKEIQKIKEEQEMRIGNAVNKKVKTWKSLGSEKEVDLNIPITSRGLYNVELYAKYPIKSKQTLRLELAGSKKFNHTDLTVSEKYMKEIIQRKRTDAEVQTKMISFNKKAQTTYNYPKNMWTQYEYNYEPVDDVVGFPNDGFERKCLDLKGEMSVNSNINFYTDDYTFLGRRNFDNGGHLVGRNEYMSVIDVKSREKIITDFVWHPLISGIFAAAYGCESSLVSKKCDDFFQEKPVYEEFWVLIWDINDTFHPKLKLACDTEIQTLSFCPHSVNILMGGGKNGQLFYWNLLDKLNTDKQNNLTIKQKSNRIKIYAIMKWKDYENTPVIPIAGKSEILKSHRASITGINWIFNAELKFMTSSVDGYIKFWNLDAMVYTESEIKLSRLLKHNIGILNADLSKTLIISGAKNAFPIRCIAQPRIDLEFEDVQIDSIKSNAVFETVKRNFVRIDDTVDSKIFLLTGTDLGDLITSTWGDEDDDEEAIDQNIIKILNTARLHDGPINSIEQHPKLPEFYLTTGGKVFAIWKIFDNTLKPFFWRKSKHFYTHAHWSLYQSTAFRLNRSDGNREIWDLSIKSDSFHYLNNYSGKALLKAAVHPFKIKNNVFGLSDEQGALRLIYVPENIQKTETEENCEKMRSILENNFQLKDSLNAWQNFWIEKYASHLIEDKKRLELEKIRKEKEAHKERIRLKEKLAREAELEAQLAELKKRPPPGKRAEWAHQKWIEKEHKILSKIMLDKKKFDRETLKEDRKPVKFKHNEKVRLLIKKREKLEKSETIFKKTIDASFPFISESSKVEKVEVIEEKEDLFKQYLDSYKEISFKCEKFLHENPYVSEIDWSQAFKDIGMRKKDLDCRAVKGRRFRIKNEILNNKIKI